jgi:hypothetical protein
MCGNRTQLVKSHSSCGSRTLHVEINFVRVGITLVCVVITLIITCHNHTLRVEITRVRVEITLVITFVRVKITMLVEITLCVYKSHSACHIHTHTCQNYSHVSRNHTLRVK